MTTFALMACGRDVAYEVDDVKVLYVNAVAKGAVSVQSLSPSLTKFTNWLSPL